MNKPVRKKAPAGVSYFNQKAMTAPYLFWSAAFIIIPLCMIFYYGLTDRSGAFTLEIDGDLFKARVTFPQAPPPREPSAAL